MKKILEIMVLVFLFNSSAYAGIGDTYTCTTEKISQLDSSNKITTHIYVLNLINKKNEK